jgi:hypothetical protein
VIGRGPAGATARACGLELSARSRRVEHLAHLDTPGGELAACSLDVFNKVPAGMDEPNGEKICPYSTIP